MSGSTARQYWHIAPPVLALLLLTSCSSNATSSSNTHQSSTTTTRLKSPTATSTIPVPPAPPNGSAVTAYLKTPGNAFLALEQATTTLDKGVIPSKSACRALAKSLSSQGSNGADAVTTAIKESKRGDPGRRQPGLPSEDCFDRSLHKRRRYPEDTTEVKETSSLIGRELTQLGITWLDPNAVPGEAIRQSDRRHS